MSSSNKKTFTTSETSKQADATITSDAILLEPTTKDHILVTTVDSSANLSGQVDIELEMSPDGQNWCPAQVKTTTTTQGQTTGGIVGNEKAVDLSGDTRNKFARGRLEYNISDGLDYSGNYPLQERARKDGSDFVHHMIAVNKSFNYSGWYNSDVQPSSTYTPVLFRNGGIDDFENTKAVQLTDITEGSLYGLQSSTAADQSTDFNLNTSGQSTTEKSLFPSLGAGANYMPSVDDDLAVAFWLKSSYAVGTSGRNCIFYQSSATGPSSNFIACYVYRISSNLNIEFFYGKAGTALKGRTYQIPFVLNEWNHIVINKNTGVPSQANISFHINGGTAAGGNDISVGSMATTDFDTTTVNDLEFFTYPRWLGSNYNRTECTPIIDEFYAIPRLLTQAEIGEFRTSLGTAEAPSNLSFISVVDSYFRFGDLSNDDVSTNKSYDGKDSNRYIQKNGSNNGSIVSLTSSDTPYPQNTTQNLCESESTFESVYNSYTSNSLGGVTIDSSTDADTFFSNGGNYSAGTYVGTETVNKKLWLGRFNPHEDYSKSRWIYIRSNGNMSTIWTRGYETDGYVLPNYLSSGSYVRFYGTMDVHVGTTYSDTDAAKKEIYVTPKTDLAAGTYTYVYDTNPVITFYRRDDNTSFTANIKEGYHMAITYTAPADITQGIPEANVAIYINGIRVKLDNITTENSVDYITGLAPSNNYFNGDETYAFNTTWDGDPVAGMFAYGTTYKYQNNWNNHIDFARTLTQDEVIKLYNNGKLLDFANMQTSFPISLTDCRGAYDADVMYRYSANNYIGGFTDCSGFGLRAVLHNTGQPYGAPTQVTFSPRLGFMADIEPLLVSYFTTSSNLSISGWFKTTDTGTLFSNTGGAAATGMTCEVTATTIGIAFKDGSPSPVVAIKDVDDGNWHHLVVTKNDAGTNEFKIYVDGVLYITSTTTGLTDADLKGDNGFTLLGDGQNNAINSATASTTDSSKLNASLSNWSIHSEVLNEYAVKQLYSNGHVRNIKNLPSVDPLAIEAWWQLNDGTNPEQDLSANGVDLQYQDGNSNTLVSQQVALNSGEATLIQDTINGNGMTLSLTKNFDFVSESWVTDASGDAAFCLSFNGFEDQAEYFALWKCHQVKQDYDVNFLDGNWHNIVLSYRNTTEGSNVKFGPYTATGIGASFNWNLSMDGIELNDQNSNIGVDYIGGLNSFLTHNNVNIGFPIYNRHLKYVGSTEENYLAHTQGGATNIYEDASGGVTPDNPYGFILQPPISTDTPWTFQGLIDETSFHSQDFWTSSGGSDPTNFESEYPATIYGNTNGLTGTRGLGATYATGIPYPLNDPSAIGASPGDSQYINPNRYDASTNPGGGLESWWRWGDTDQDCGENINDVKDKLDGVSNHHLRAVSIDTQDLHLLVTAPDSTYLEPQEATTSQGSAITEFVSVVMSNIVDTACNVKDLAQPILQYLRVKITGTGSVDLGEGKAETSIYFTKRRKK